MRSARPPRWCMVGLCPAKHCRHPHADFACHPLYLIAVVGACASKGALKQQTWWANGYVLRVKPAKAAVGKLVFSLAAAGKSRTDVALCADLASAGDACNTVQKLCGGNTCNVALKVRSCMLEVVTADACVSLPALFRGERACQPATSKARPCPIASDRRQPSSPRAASPLSAVSCSAPWQLSSPPKARAPTCFPSEIGRLLLRELGTSAGQCV